VGGTVDPETGEVIWEWHVPLEEQPAFYGSHPPRMLDGLTCAPIEPPRPPEFTFDGHGERVNAVFVLACPCGSRLFTVVCYFDDGEISSPIQVECAACDRDQTIFWTGKHGYDAEVSPETPQEEGEFPETLACEEIPAPHEVLVRLEYPSEQLGDPEWKGREQDLFSWITIVARDPKTGELGFLFDEECA
jgi:hypothetical protein